MWPASPWAPLALNTAGVSPMGAQQRREGTHAATLNLLIASLGYGPMSYQSPSTGRNRMAAIDTALAARFAPPPAPAKQADHDHARGRTVRQMHAPP